MHASATPSKPVKTVSGPLPASSFAYFRPIESGEIEINRGGELLRGRKGDVIYLPKGIPHALRVIGTDEGVVLVVCVVPGGFFDRFFAACAEEFKKGEPEMPLLVKLAAEYGIEFQSGPPS